MLGEGQLTLGTSAESRADLAQKRQWEAGTLIPSVCAPPCSLPILLLSLGAAELRLSGGRADGGSAWSPIQVHRADWSPGGRVPPFLWVQQEARRGWGQWGEPRSVPREPPEASSFARLGGGNGERLGLRLLPLILPKLGRFFFPKSQKTPRQLQIDTPVWVWSHLLSGATNEPCLENKCTFFSLFKLVMTVI